MTAIQAYALAKKLIKSAATGIADITVEGNSLIFHLQNGEQLNMEVPLPKDGDDGLSITAVKINEDNHLICTMSDGTEIDAGELPSSGGGGSITWKSW